MPDPRFFENAGPVALSEIAQVAGVAYSGDLFVSEAAPLARAGATGVAFLHDKRYLADLSTTRACAVFVAPAHAERVPDGCAALVTREPQAAWARAAARLHPARRLVPGAAVHETAVFEDDVELAPGVVVGAGVRIGRGSRIGANTVIGPGVAIGRDCRIGANVSIGFALIGDRVTVLSGAVVGESGFGVAAGAGGAVDIPQLGRAILQDGVSIGAVTCVDRGAWDDTVIGENTKLDNQVQVAHGVRLGRNCLAAAQTGISGSTVAGDGVVFGGKAGVADHLTIGDGARIAGGAGLTRDVPAGETWSGYPAQPIRRWLREQAWLSRAVHGKGEGG